MREEQLLGRLFGVAILLCQLLWGVDLREEQIPVFLYRGKHLIVFDQPTQELFLIVFGQDFLGHLSIASVFVINR